MSKSDLLKDSMKGGLDGLLSPTKKTTGGKQPVAAPTEKETAVHCNFVINKSIHTRMKFLAIKKNMSLKDILWEELNKESNKIEGKVDSIAHRAKDLSHLQEELKEEGEDEDLSYEYVNDDEDIEERACWQ